MAEQLTEAGIRAMALPSSGRVIVADARERYLRLYLTPTTKTWYYCRKVDGRARQVRLGQWPEMPVALARRVASERSGQVAACKPLQQDGRAVPTVETAWSRYLAGHLKPHTRGWLEMERLYRLHLASWSSRRVDSLTVELVRRWHGALGESAGPYAANRALELLRAMLNWCAKEVGQDWGAPCRGVRRFREQSRQRFLSPAEMGRFWSALAEEPNRTWRDLWTAMLLTGQRRANVQAMRWEELNLDEGTWTIPAAKAKAGEPITVALVGPVVAMLQGRRELADGPWVFPAKSASGHVQEPKKAWQDLLARADLVDLHMHDLRRTLGSWQAAAGSSLQVIGRSLGHRSLQATAIYARLTLDPVRASVEAATAAMLAQRDTGVEPE